MEKRAVFTDRAPAAVGPYSQAVVAGGLIFVSGQIGIDPATGKLVEGGAEAQARQALDNLEAILKAAGSSLEHAVKTTLILANMGDFQAVNRVYGERFHAVSPARASFAAQGLPLGALVEIDAVALERPLAT